VVAVLATAASGGGWYLGSGRYTESPAVVGLDPAAATQQLVAADLEVVVAEQPVADEVVPAGMVLSQDPGPDSRLLRGSTVTLVLSSGPDRRVVPQLAGKDGPAATAELEALGLRVAQTEEFSPEPAGAVLRTDPAADERVKPDTEVMVFVSKGLEMLPVPGVVGRPQAEADGALREAGFAPVVREVFSEDVAKGLVVAQEPRDGTAPRDSEVGLDVSKGPAADHGPRRRRQEPRAGRGGAEGGRPEGERQRAARWRRLRPVPGPRRRHQGAQGHHRSPVFVF
jgi:serine/threonine-protein kinase